MPRLTVRPQDNIALGDFALDMLKREAEEHRPLDRDAVIFNLERAASSAEAGNAHATVMYLKVGLVHRENGLTAWVGP